MEKSLGEALVKRLPPTKKICHIGDKGCMFNECNDECVEYENHMENYGYNKRAKIDIDILKGVRVSEKGLEVTMLNWSLRMLKENKSIDLINGKVLKRLAHEIASHIGELIMTQ